MLNTAANDIGRHWVSNGVTLDDDDVVGETITTGADGIRETSLVTPNQAPVNLPTKEVIEEKLDTVFGKQANIFFDVKFVKAVSVAYDRGDQAGAYPEYPFMKNPNGRFDFFLDDRLSPEEELVRAVAYDGSVDFNLYYFGSNLAFNVSNAAKTVHKTVCIVGHARSLKKTPYIVAY